MLPTKQAGDHSRTRKLKFEALQVLTLARAAQLAISLALVLRSQSSSIALPSDSIAIQCRKITAREFNELLESGNRIILLNDTIIGDLPVGGTHRPRLGNIDIRNCVFEENLVIGEIEVGKYSSLRFDSCHFKKGVLFGLCTFLPWSNLFLTKCRHDGLVTFDKCELKPLTEVFIDSCRFGNGLIVGDCKGEWLFRFMNSKIVSGCVVYGTSWHCEFMKSVFLPGGFIEGDFSASTLWDCTFLGTAFEMTSLPTDQSMGRCSGIKNLSFKDSPAGLSALRDWYRLNGYRQKEREATFALKRTENSLNPQPARFIQWFLFDFTCAWGMEYERPLLLALALLLLLWPVYLDFAGSHKNGDIQRVWTVRSRREGSVLRAISIHRLRPFARRKILLLPRLTLLFSLMSAFNIGFRDFNFGRWIRNITKREYDLKAAGWARTFSGLQALISVYLFALFLLTYFGRPFD